MLISKVTTNSLICVISITGKRVIELQHIRTLFVPFVPFVVQKSGEKGIPAFMLACIKASLPCQMYELYPISTGPLAPRRTGSTCGKREFGVYFSNLRIYLNNGIMEKEVRSGWDTCLLKLFHDQDSSPVISAHSSKSDGAPYCALGWHCLDGDECTHVAAHIIAFIAEPEERYTDSSLKEEPLTSSEKFGLAHGDQYNSLKLVNTTYREASIFSCCLHAAGVRYKIDSPIGSGITERTKRVSGFRRHSWS